MVEADRTRPAGSDTRAGSGSELVCPRCEAVLADDDAHHSTPKPGALPRCPEHGLAYVRRSVLERARDDPWLGATVGKRFTVMAPLGVGSMGSIYRARQEAVGRDVALKIVRRPYDPEARVRFEREAQATSALVSPYTVTVFDFGELGRDSWYLAMELLEGETLGERLRREGRLDVGEAIAIARQALTSLSEAHTKGIVHRDLKPDNLFLARVPTGPDAAEGEVCKVLDFGIAKLMHEEARIDSLETQAGTVFGTPRYMSPEQAQGADLDARSDLYSLGVILFQMLAGRPPFVDDDAVVVMARHIENDAPGIREVAPGAEVPVEVEAVVRRALHKEPAQRFESAAQFASELESAVEQAGVSGTGTHRISWVAPPSTSGPTSGRTSRGRGVRPLLLTGAALAAVLAVGLMLSGRRAVDATSDVGSAAVRGGTRPGAAVVGAQASAAAQQIPVGAGVPPGAEAGAVEEETADAGSDASAVRRQGRSGPRGARGTPEKRVAPDVRSRPGDRYGRFE